MKIINGKTIDLRGSEKLKAVNEFYRAFNERDLKLMQSNWSNGTDIVMNNPLGEIKRGWSEISSVYKKLFEEGAKVYVEFYDYSLYNFAEGFYVVGRERGNIEIDESFLSLDIRTTRIFAKIQQKWKQVHHHGSIADVEILRKYQEIVAMKSKKSDKV